MSSSLLSPLYTSMGYLPLALKAPSKGAHLRLEETEVEPFLLTQAFLLEQVRSLLQELEACLLVDVEPRHRELLQLVVVPLVTGLFES